MPYMKQESTSSGYESEDVMSCKLDNEARDFHGSSSTLVSSMDELDIPEDEPSACVVTTTATTVTNDVPEYKQILQTMFNLFGQSRRKYPIPMIMCPVPVIQGARRQSERLSVLTRNR